MGIGDWTKFPIHNAFILEIFLFYTLNKLYLTAFFLFLLNKSFEDFKCFVELAFHILYFLNYYFVYNQYFYLNIHNIDLHLIHLPF